MNTEAERNEAMACKMTDAQWDAVRTDVANLGQDFAEWVADMDGALGASRAGIITAFLERYDARAAEILSDRLLRQHPIAGEDA